MSPTRETPQRETLQRERARSAGQEHVFAHWARLDEAARAGLLEQLEGVDYELTGALARQAASPAGEAPASFQPPELFPLRRDPGSEHEQEAERARRAGEELLRSGGLGYLLVAGGQASRLGYDGPKGAFPVGPVSRRSLFELHARRLRAAGVRFGVPTPFYVMTSPANDAATRAFFEEHQHFGLPPEDVFFFAQAMLPALDLEGRILMAGPGELFLAPNGHGGVLAALAASGGLADARARGVRTFSFFQVDNPLTPPADPLFVGMHARAGAEMSSKVVSKRDANEKVGVLGRADGVLGCIEYSDLPEELREARDEAGELVFRAGNIAIHLIELEFIERLTSGELELPWHVARKKMRALDAAGAPAEREGHKFETFVFDALGHARASVTLEADRGQEFSPVKNAAGDDSPRTARRDLCRLHASWVEAVGLELPEPDAEGVHPVEVDPLCAESEAELRARAPLEPRRTAEGHLFE